MKVEIEKFDQDEKAVLSPDAKLLKEKGVVREQWEPAGAKIEYIKSKVERSGWNVPGAINKDDEEDVTFGQNDLHQDFGNAGV